tara:strand:- start:7908 stop:9737 length:1830 start_codon:yes stop_codon:yes gene_type:complete
MAFGDRIRNDTNFFVLPPNIASDIMGFRSIITSAPKSRFQYFAVFVFNKNTEVSSLLSQYTSDLEEIAAKTSAHTFDKLTQDSKKLGFICKQVDLPRFQIQYEMMNQYNRKKPVIKKIDWNPIQISMHDTADNLAWRFWNAIYQYHFLEASLTEPAGSSAQGSASKINFANNMLAQDDYFTSTQHHGLRPLKSGTGSLADGYSVGTNHKPIKELKLFQVYNGKYNLIRFIHPMCIAAEHSAGDYASSEPFEINMQFAFENVIYDQVEELSVGFGESSTPKDLVKSKARVPLMDDMFNQTVGRFGEPYSEQKTLRTQPAQNDSNNYEELLKSRLDPFNNDKAKAELAANQEKYNQDLEARVQNGGTDPNNPAFKAGENSATADDIASATGSVPGSTSAVTGTNPAFSDDAASSIPSGGKFSTNSVAVDLPNSADASSALSKVADAGGALDNKAGFLDKVNSEVSKVTSAVTDGVSSVKAGVGDAVNKVFSGAGITNQTTSPVGDVLGNIGGSINNQLSNVSNINFSNIKSQMGSDFANLQSNLASGNFASGSTTAVSSNPVKVVPPGYKPFKGTLKSGQKMRNINGKTYIVPNPDPKTSRNRPKSSGTWV